MLRFFAALALVMGATLSANAGEMERPADLALKRPDASVPAPCVAYFGGWGKGDYGGRATELWVEEVSPTCEVLIIYVWGPMPGSRIAAEAGYRRVPGRIDLNGDGKLHFELKEFGARAEYELVGGKLHGKFTNKWNNVLRTQLEKLDLTNLALN